MKDVVQRQDAFSKNCKTLKYELLNQKIVSKGINFDVYYMKAIQGDWLICRLKKNLGLTISILLNTLLKICI